MVVAAVPGPVVGFPLIGTAVVPRAVPVRLPVPVIPGPVPVLPVTPRLVAIGSAVTAGPVPVGLPLTVTFIGPPLSGTAVVPRTAVAVRLPVVPAVPSGFVAVGLPFPIALVIPAGPVGPAAGVVPLPVVRPLAVAGAVSGPSVVAIPVRLLSVPSAAVAAVFALRSVSGSGVFFRGGHGISTDRHTGRLLIVMCGVGAVRRSSGPLRPAADRLPDDHADGDESGSDPFHRGHGLVQ